MNQKEALQLVGLIQADVARALGPVGSAVVTKILNARMRHLLVVGDGRPLSFSDEDFHPNTDLVRCSAMERECALHGVPLDRRALNGLGYRSVRAYVSGVRVRAWQRTDQGAATTSDRSAAS